VSIEDEPINALYQAHNQLADEKLRAFAVVTVDNEGNVCPTFYVTVAEPEEFLQLAAGCRALESALAQEAVKFAPLDGKAH
jgi:hypothetical protein